MSKAVPQTSLIGLAGLFAIISGMAESYATIEYPEEFPARKAYLVTAINRLAKQCGFESMTSDGVEFQQLVFEIEDRGQSYPLDKGRFNKALNREARELDRLLAEKDCGALKDDYDSRRLWVSDILKSEKRTQAKMREFLSVPD